MMCPEKEEKMVEVDATTVVDDAAAVRDAAEAGSPGAEAAFEGWPLPAPLPGPTGPGPVLHAGLYTVTR